MVRSELEEACRVLEIDCPKDKNVVEIVAQLEEMMNFKGLQARLWGMIERSGG